MRRMLTMLMGMACGALIMFLMDPERGRSRRAQMRDKAMSIANQSQDAIEGKVEDLSNRAQGMMAEAKSAVSDNVENMTQGISETKAQMTEAMP